MKRLNSSDSLGAFMSVCPSTDEHSPRTTNHYSREFQSMLDGLDNDVCTEEGGHVVEKKRRLSVDQVKALEKNFEVENKLEPERKVKLAQELGLQPRQVAVWFQNRRARWKTKQLERDYGVLKANYESLKLNFESLQHENGNLLKQIKELKAKLNEENTESNISIKEEIILPDCDDTPLIETVTAQESKDINANNSNNNNGVVEVANFFQDLKDGSSDSDSSAILNEDNSPNHGQLIMSPPPSSSSMNCFQFMSSKTYSETQFVKMEEHNFFSSEETCNFFSDEQPPSLQWYCPDQWN